MEGHHGPSTVVTARAENDFVDQPLRTNETKHNLPRTINRRNEHRRPLTLTLSLQNKDSEKTSNKSEGVFLTWREECAVGHIGELGGCLLAPRQQSRGALQVLPGRIARRHPCHGGLDNSLLNFLHLSLYRRPFISFRSREKSSCFYKLRILHAIGMQTNCSHIHLAFQGAHVWLLLCLEQIKTSPSVP